MIPLLLLGNSSSVLVASILPCLIHLILMKKQMTMANIIGDVLLTAVSVVVMVICTVVSFKSLLKTFM